jgi:hypothetical protein
MVIMFSYLFQEKNCPVCVSCAGVPEGCISVIWLPPVTGPRAPAKPHVGVPPYRFSIAAQGTDHCLVAYRKVFRVGVVRAFPHAATQLPQPNSAYRCSEVMSQYPHIPFGFFLQSRKVYPVNYP